MLIYNPPNISSGSQTNVTVMPVINFKEHDGIPLPIGGELNTPGRRVHSNPLFTQLADNVTVHSSTDNGWPTLLIGKHEGSKVGVAVDYIGDWHADHSVEEIDIILNENQVWGAVVVYETRSAAVESGNYNTGEYQGYELYKWDVESRIDVISDCIDRNVTPIFYTEEAPDQHYADAYQRAESFDTLKRLFGLSQYQRIFDRQERLYNIIVPREERWRNKDTQYQDLARSILENDSDTDDNKGG